ncbi:hypothetical protein FRC17_009084 [Serendipita sp. 399]|nr:hypothetical protein FRC17_009084 [Serendipita sp. 399]
MNKPIYRCLPPCNRAFDSEKKLVQHYQNRPSCAITWRTRENLRLRAAFQSVAQRQDTIWSNEVVGSELDACGIDNNPNDLNDAPDTYLLPIEDDNDDADEDYNTDDAASVLASVGDVDEFAENSQYASMEEFDNWLHNHRNDDQQSDAEWVDPYGMEPLDGDEDVGDDDEMVDDAEGGDEDIQEPIDEPCSFQGSEDAEPQEVDRYPGAGEIKELRRPRYEDILATRDPEKDRNLFSPFNDLSEFKLAKWLNDLPLSKVDSFLKLEYIQSTNLSFRSGKTMRQRIKRLPTPRIQWKTTKIVPRSGTTSSTVYLSYRDPVDAIRSLLDRPSLAKYVTFAPERHWKNKAEGTRVYSEIFTGEWAWKTQATLKPGSTLLAVLLGSDKAHLTEYSGDKSAWPLYLSLGNIHSSVRNKPTMQCWILLAYIPIPIFTESKSQHTALQQRLFHQCLDVVLKSIKHVGKKGKDMRDSLGNVRRCYTRIAAYLADYPEQVLINVAAQNNSPVTTAGHHDLGDSLPHPRRTKEWILSQIEKAKQMVDPSNIEEYTEVAKELGLNAVDRPFWCHHVGYEPDLIIAPDILHGLFRFWRDHILKWVRYLVGAAELDHRVKALQPITGFRHFVQGISHLSQWTGREDRELQRILLSVIAGAPKVSPKVMQALRAFHDFLYLALSTFHEHKDVFIKTGARRGKNGIIKHFRIPKLPGLHSYIYHIPRMGTSTQFSTEIMETCHQEMAKAAYKATNRKEFFQQMAAYLNRKEILTLMEDFSSWYFERLHEDTRCGRPIPSLPGYEKFVSEMIAAGQKNAQLEIRQASCAKGGYIWLTIKPDQRGLLVDVVATLYGLPNLHTNLVTYMGTLEGVGLPSTLPLLRCDVWYRCRIQRPTIQDVDALTDTRVVQAVPSNISNTRHGLCNCVLVKSDDDAEEAGIVGYRVAQMRLIFTLRLPPTHPLHGTPLAYVYWFSDPSSRPERNINMYQVRYLRGDDRRRIGGIIPLNSICRLLQLVPKYGSCVNPELTKENSMDVWKDYYINSFMDKETYQAVW